MTTVLAPISGDGPSGAEATFRALMVATQSVTDIVGQRVALNAVPEGAAIPLIVFTARHAPVITLGNDTIGDQCTIEAQCWAQTAAEAEALADAVTWALDAAPASSGAVVLGRASTFDAELGLDGVQLTIDWWTD